LGPVFRALPVSVSLFLGRRLGDAFHFFDAKHRALAYANIRKALHNELSPADIRVVTKQFYRNFGQNFIEMFLLPKVDKDYLARNITVEGAEHVSEALKSGKGVILLAVHAGSWELTNVICSNLGFPFNFFVREQKFPRLNGLLNTYRAQRGCKLITRQNQIRALIDVLKHNEVVGMTVDQGGRYGEKVTFLGHEASMSSGAVKIALKYGSAILPAFYLRPGGARVKTIIGNPFEVRKTRHAEDDTRANLQELMRFYEDCIRRYPAEYLWTYKIWKYSTARSVLIISDGKTGHLRQSEAVARELARYGSSQAMRVSLETLTVRFRDSRSRIGIAVGSLCTGKYSPARASRLLERFLAPDSYESLKHATPDMIISCGASVAHVNYLFSRLNHCRSICVLRPGLLGVNRFDAVIMPGHDRPPRRKNVYRTDGALNIVDKEHVAEQSQKLLDAYRGRLSRERRYIGFLVGGDTKHFTLQPEAVRSALGQIKDAALRLDYDILITTSRRTSLEVERLLEKECKDFPRCKLLINARVDNPSYALGGILGLSAIKVVSPESISMVSEAASCPGHVVVFGGRVDSRHDAFLRTLEHKGYIYRAPAANIAGTIGFIHNKKPADKILNDIDTLGDCIRTVF